MRNLHLVTPIMALAALTSCEEDKPQQKNVILVMCDDLGWGDVGFNGNTVIQTPNIDRMAASGVTFDRFYSACAVSSPTRASVLTGRSPFRTGVFDANVGILRTEEVTIPEILKEEGYATGHFGKWHLGSLTASEKDANRGRVGNEKELNPPSLHGYDDAFVTESKVPTWDPMLRPEGQVSHLGWNYIKEGEPTVHYGTHYWDINGNKVTDNLEGDDSRVIMDRVLPFIASSKEAEKPFLAVIWFHTPHLPCVAGPDHAALYQGKGYSDEFINYAGCITAMDEQMGRLQKYLEDNGLAENSVIWFCSDNGPENCPEDGGGITGGFKERKRSLHEGGVRVPAFVCGAGVEKGLRTSFPAVTSDYLPTVLSMLDIDSSKAPHELDGVDLSAVVKGENISRESPIISVYKGQISYSGNRYKYYTKGEIEQWYDIVEDPYEEYPLTSAPDMEQKLKATSDILSRYRASFEGEEYGRESYNMMEQSWQVNSSIGDR